MRRQAPDVELAAAVRDLAAAIREQTAGHYASNPLPSVGGAVRALTDLIPGKPRT